MAHTDHPAKPRTQQEFERRTMRREARQDAAERREQRGRDLAESMLVLGLDPDQPTMQPVETDVPAHEMDMDGARTWIIEPSHPYNPSIQHTYYCSDCTHEFVARTNGYPVDPWMDDDGEHLRDADTDGDSWLTTMSMSDAYHELGPDGWHIERGGQSDPIDTSHAYIRVNQLARDLGMPSRVILDMIRDLGEFTVSHSSNVATPIADHITSTLGTRRATTTDAIANLRRSLM